MSKVSNMQCTQFAADGHLERLRVQSAMRLPGVEFWSISDSLRRWSMHHDTFSAVLLSATTPALQVTWHSRGGTRTATGGSIQLMEPGEVHRTLRVSAPVSALMICWTPAALQRAANELGVPGSARFERPQLDDLRVTGAFLRLHASLSAAHDALEIESLYTESIGRLLECGCEPPSSQPARRYQHPMVRRALARLHESFAQPISLDALAREANLSKYYFARSFRAVTGFAPHQYQRLLRLQAARRLLERGASVEEAADRVGFADAPHLTRAFREWLGITPGVWARGLRAASAPRPVSLVAAPLLLEAARSERVFGAAFGVRRNAVG